MKRKRSLFLGETLLRDIREYFPSNEFSWDLISNNIVVNQSKIINLDGTLIYPLIEIDKHSEKRWDKEDMFSIFGKILKVI